MSMRVDSVGGSRGRPGRSGSRATLSLLAVGLAAACSGDREDRSPTITLARSAGGEWQVTFRLTEETSYLRFQRPAGFYREGTWRVVSPGWSLDRDGDHQTLIAAAGSGAREVTLEIPVHTEHIPKEYELFRSFTDGSLAVYTGHFYVTTAKPGVAGERFIRRLALEPAPGERLIVHGQVIETPIDWEDPHGDGTYVYYGSIPPLETDDMIGIIDPGAPAWLVERMHQTLPEVFADFAEGFDEPLPWKPVVLFSFEESDSSGLSSGGGTLNGLVQMSAAGKGWAEETARSTEQWLYLIAHESAHLWNGQLHTYDGMTDSWMHEGSADALARWIQLRHGVIDAERLAGLRTEALDRCSTGLGDGSLSTSADRGQFHNYYACGELIAVWSVAVLHGSDDMERLFDLWRAVFRAADPSEGYDRRTYLGALASLGAEPESIEALRRFVDDVHPDPSASLAEFMSRAGIELVRLERPLPEARPRHAMSALSHLMAVTCSGRYSVSFDGPGLRTGSVQDCPVFSHAMLVTSIEGNAIGAAGDLALEAAAERCSNGENIVLGLENGAQVRVPCDVPPPRKPAPLAFPGPPARASATVGDKAPPGER